MAVRRKQNHIADLGKLVDDLCSTHTSPERSDHGARGQRLLPSRTATIAAVEELRGVMFPGYFGTTDLSPASVCYHVGGTLDRVRHVLAEQIHRCFRYVCECDVGALECPDCAERADNATEAFLARLPEVKRLLGTDVQAAYEGDPAATSPDETILCYPGIMAITNHRLAHELYRLEVPLLSRMIAEHAHSLTGIDIHPGATIAESFFIDHGTGVVVGETSVLGKNVRLYQGVTLGAKSFPLDADGNPIKGIPRHPILEDEVVIYAGATVLGRITIGKGSVIGGNVWLTKDVPANSRISQTTPQPTVESSAK